MPEWFMQILVAGAIYGGIRADMKNMAESIKQISEKIEKDNINTNKRIDGILTRHK